jgi:hypothetical protein
VPELSFQLRESSKGTGEGSTQRGRLVAVSSHREWWVTCRDIAGRRRDLQVIARKGQVVLVAPPGETAILTPLDVGRLRAALRDAVVNAAEPEPEPPLRGF